MSELDLIGPRKKLRVGHVSERGAVNAVRSLLEAHDLVVDELDGRNDYGRDLNVEVTLNGAITGLLFGVQVKANQKFTTGDVWHFPVSNKDRRYWLESSVPIIGIMWSPGTFEMRWINLTGFARRDPSVMLSRGSNADMSVFALDSIPLTDAHVLNPDTLQSMIAAITTYITSLSSSSIIGLCDEDDDVRCQAVMNCWIVGRGDARAFILLRGMLPSLRGRSMIAGISVLTHLTMHPDIFWHSGNWVPRDIELQVDKHFRWSSLEIYQLVAAVEEWSDGEDIWHRGGPGQDLWSLLVRDDHLGEKTSDAIGIAMRGLELMVALRILIIHQYLSKDPVRAMRLVFLKYPYLREHPFARELMLHIDEHGSLDVY